jgi:tetratricopeptide (TPR) repeat protein
MIRQLPIPLVVALLAGAGEQAAAQCAGNAQAMYQERKYDEARAETQAQLKQNPNAAATLYCMGRIATAQEKSGEAVDWFEKAVKVDDRNSLYHLWLGQALGTEAQRANKLRQPFLARRVRSEFERAVALDPTSIDARHGLIQFYAVAPGIVGGSMDKAKAQAAEIGKLNAMRGHIELAVLLEREKDYTNAELEYLAAVTNAHSDSVVAPLTLGAFYQRRQKWDEAFALYDRVIKEKPDNINAHLGYARISAISGKNLERGESELKTILADPPKDWTQPTLSAVHTRLGMIYEKQGRKELARAEYDQAVSLNAKNEEAKKALLALKS